MLSPVLFALAAKALPMKFGFRSRAGGQGRGLEGLLVRSNLPHRGSHSLTAIADRIAVVQRRRPGRSRNLRSKAPQSQRIILGANGPVGQRARC